ncbi:MAG: ABC transporter ATP-binding protein [Desulfobacterales bacterium]
MIVADRVTKIFNRGRPEEFTALSGVSLTITAGEAVVLMGPSGSGKTTLLSILGALSRPTSGRVQVEGREITRLPEKSLSSIRRRTFGFVFPQPHLVRGMRVIDNVMLPALPVREPEDGLRERAQKLLERLGLGCRARARAETLSSGEAQRVALARALIFEPKIVIADEPTAHLDTARASELIALLASLPAEGKTLVIASHDPLVAEAPFVDRILPMRDGRLLKPDLSP